MCGFHRRGGRGISAHVVHRGEFVDCRCSGFFWALKLASFLRQKKVLSNCEMENPHLTFEVLMGGMDVVIPVRGFQIRTGGG